VPARPSLSTRNQNCGAVCLLVAFLVALALAGPRDLARAENPKIAKLRAAEQRNFTDAQIAEGFFKIAFGAELAVAGRTDRIRKYDRPVRVSVESRAKPDRRRQVADTVADIAARIEHIDIATTDDPRAANVAVTLVHNRDLAATIRAFYGRGRARQIARSLEPQCLSGFGKDDQYRILHSDVILVADGGDFIFYDCAYEELLQALGPINDDSSVPWSMFNDNVSKGFFDVYDQYLLNILYDPRVRPGMTRDEVRAVLPQVLPSVRAFVTRVNGLEP
jgi:hypothetical protein